LRAWPTTNSISPTGFISSGTRRAEHRLAFEEHRRDDVVAATQVAQQLGQEIAPARLGVPEMMMRIDDRQVGLERLLRRPLGEPGGEIGIVAIGETAIFAVLPCLSSCCLAYDSARAGR
jgi:hypothetical protein